MLELRHLPAVPDIEDTGTVARGDAEPAAIGTEGHRPRADVHADELPPVPGVPHARVGPGGGDKAAVWTERDIVRRLAVADAQDLVAIRAVPDTYRVTDGGGGEPGSVWAVHDSPDFLGVPQLQQFAPVLGVPHPHSVIAGCGSQPPAVRAERDSPDEPHE